MSSTPMTAAPFDGPADPLTATDSPTTLRAAVRRFFRHGSPRILATLTLIAVGARIAVGGWSWTDLLAVVVIAALWPLQEWLIHVFILHLKPFRLLGRTIDLPVPRKHRAHHRDPGNIDILFIPTHVYLYVPALQCALAFGLLPLSTALTVLAFYYLLALDYEWIHYLIHTRYVPRSRFYRRLWVNHRRHHYKNEQFWYGVTMLGGDTLLGTAPDHRSVPTSPTCRDLDAELTLGT